MSASAHVRRERQELAELMLAVGPDSPTLCEGWTTHDLAAHLVVRESRPDAAAGLALPPLSGWTDRVQRAAAQRPYPELVRAIRTGPPTLSIFSLPGAEGVANLNEYVVHHEDVRRALPGWEPREVPVDLADELWKRLRQMSRLTFRRMPVGVTLVRTDGSGGSFVARSAPSGSAPHSGEMVTLTGSTIDLLLRSYGRRAVHVEISGSSAAVAAFESARLAA